MEEKIKLFNLYGASNATGQLVSDTVDNFLSNLIRESEGIDLNDLELVIHHTVGAIFAEARLRRATTMRKRVE